LEDKAHCTDNYECISDNCKWNGWLSEDDNTCGESNWLSTLTDYGIAAFISLLPIPGAYVMYTGIDLLVDAKACSAASDQGTSSQPRYPASSYDQELALMLFAYSWASYCPQALPGSVVCQVFGGSPDTCPATAADAYKPSADADFYVHPGLNGNAFVHVKLASGAEIVAFRGTINLDTAVADLETWKTDYDGCSSTGCSVHSGFYGSWQSIKSQVEQVTSNACKTGTPLHMTGHSLGGAIATIAAFELHRKGCKVATAYTFGGPRAGNNAFAVAFNALDIKQFRVVNGRDPVPHLPPTGFGFEHPGYEVWYGQGSNCYKTYQPFCYSQPGQVCGSDTQCPFGTGDTIDHTRYFWCLLADNCKGWLGELTSMLARD